MALGEVVDKGLDICRDGLIAPSAVAFLHPAFEVLPEWAMHLTTAFVFVVTIAVVKEVRRNRHHHFHLHHREAAVPARRVPPSKIRSVSIPT